MTQFSTLSPAARDGIAAWRRYLEAPEPALLDAIFADEVVFRSPFVHKPYHGLAAVRLIMGAVTRALQDFRVERELVGDQDAALEFVARIGDIEVHGVDIFHFRDDGKVVRFEVMVRPHKALMALHDSLSALVGDGLSSFKQPAG